MELAKKNPYRVSVILTFEGAGSLIAPFLGVAFSLMLVGERPGVQFYLALAVLVVGTVLIVKDTLEEK